MGVSGLCPDYDRRSKIYFSLQIIIVSFCIVIIILIVYDSFPSNQSYTIYVYLKQQFRL